MNVVPLTSSIDSSRDISADEVLCGFTRLFNDLAVQTERIGCMDGDAADVVLIKAAIVASATHLLNANMAFVNHFACNATADTD